MPSFDVVSETARLPVGRDIRWSAASLGADEDAFAGIHVALQRMEGEGHVQILGEDRGKAAKIQAIYRSTLLGQELQGVNGQIA